MVASIFDPGGNLTRLISSAKEVDQGDLISKVKDDWVPCPYKNALLKRSTLLGRVFSGVTWGNEEQRWESIFREALAPENWSEGHELSHWQYSQLYRLRQQFCWHPQDHVGRYAMHMIAPAMADVERVSEEPQPWFQDPDQLESFSALDGATGAPLEYFSVEVFSAVYGLTARMPLADLLDYMHSFCITSPALHADAIATTDILTQGLSFERRLCDILKHGRRNVEDGHREVYALAVDMAEDVANMEDDTEVVFFGGIASGSEGLLKLLRKFLSNVLPIDSLVETGDIDQCIEHLAATLARDLEREYHKRVSPEKIELIKTILRDGALKACFPRVHRWMPSSMQWLIFPDAVRESLHSVLVDAIPEGLGHEVADEFCRSIIDRGLSETVRDVMQLFLRSGVWGARDKIGSSLSDVFRGMHNVGVHILGHMGIAELDQPIWYDIKKQADGTYTLSMYVTNSAIAMHAKSASGGDGKYQVPIHFDGLTSDQLDAEFFAAMLEYRVRPQWHDEVTYTIYHVHQGLLAQLNKKPREPSLDELVHKNSPETNGVWGIMQTFLRDHFSGLRDESERRKFIGSFRYQALMDLWRLSQVDDKLFRDNPGLKKRFLEGAHILVKDKWDELQQGKITETDFKRIYATVWNIEKSLQSVDNIGLIKFSQNTFLNAMNALGVTPFRMNLIKATVIGIGGEAIEEVIDTTTEAVAGRQIDHHAIDLRAELGSLPARISRIFSREQLRRLKDEIFSEVRRRVEAMCHFWRLESLQLALQWLMGRCAGLAFTLGDFLMLRFGYDFLTIIVPERLREAGNRFASAVWEGLVTFALNIAIRLGLPSGWRNYLTTLARNYQQTIIRDGNLTYDVFGEQEYGSFEVDGFSHSFEMPPHNVEDDVLCPDIHEEALVPGDVRTKLEHTVTYCESLAAQFLPNGEYRSIAEVFSLDDISARTVPLHRKFFRLCAQLNIAVCDLLQGLEVPSRERRTFWSALSRDDIIPCMDALTKLTVLLDVLRPANTHFIDGTHPSFGIAGRRELCFQAVVSSYHAYAILDFLSRRYDRRIRDFEVHAWELVHWFNDSFVTIANPKVVSQFGGVCAYFGIDMRKKYSVSEMHHLANRSLFNYTFFYEGVMSYLPGRGGFSWGEDDDHHTLKVKLATDGFWSEESKLLNSLLGDEDVVRKMSFFGLGEGATLKDRLLFLFGDPLFGDAQQRRQREVEEAMQTIRYLIDNKRSRFRRWRFTTEERRHGITDMASYEQFLKGRLLPEPFPEERAQEYVVPYHIHLLRMVACFSRTTVFGEDSDEIPFPNCQLLCKEDGTLDYSRAFVIREATQRSASPARRRAEGRGFWRNVAEFFSSCSFETTVPRIGGTFSDNIRETLRVEDLSRMTSMRSGECGVSTVEMTGKLGQMLLRAPRKQDDIINNPQRVSKHLYSEEQRMLEMIFSEEQDRVVRAFSFFNKRMKLLAIPKYQVIFELAVLQPGYLRHQLGDNPRFARRIGKFFCDAIEYFKRLDQDHGLSFVLKIGPVVYSQCLAWYPQHCDTFPSFSSEIITMISTIPPYKQRQQINAYQLLSAAYLYIDPQTAPEYVVRQGGRDLIAGLVSLVKLRNASESLYRSLMEELKLNEDRTFKLWMPTIAQQLNEDRTLRSTVCNGILVAQGFDEASLSALLWHGEFPLYTSSMGSVNVAKLTAEGELYRHREIISVEKMIEDRLLPLLGGDKFTLRLVDDGKYYIVENNTFVEFRRSESTQEKKFHVYKEISGRNYFLVPKDKCRGLPDVEENESYWIENIPSRSGLRRMLVMKDGTIKQRMAVSQHQYEGVLFYRIVSKYIIVHGIVLEEVDFSSTCHGMRLLSWFQPAKDIKLYRDGTGDIVRIDFPRMNLMCEMRPCFDGSQQPFVANTLPGFYIHPKQKIDTLQCRYLVLRKDGHDNIRRVVVPVGNIAQNLTIPVCKGMGILPEIPLLHEHLHSAMSAVVKQEALESYYVYGVDDTGKLTSDDTEALAYMFAYYYAGKEYDMALHYFEQVENRGKREKFNTLTMQYLNTILAFALLFADDDAVLINLRLAAIKEENQLLQATKDRTKAKKMLPKQIAEVDIVDWDIIIWLSIQKSYLKYLDNLDKGQDSQLDDYQRLFIFNGMSRAAREVLRNKFKLLPAKINAAINYVSDREWTEHILMPPRLISQYAALRSKHGIDDSFINRCVARVGQDTTDTLGDRISRGVNVVVGTAAKAAHIVSDSYAHYLEQALGDFGVSDRSQGFYWWLNGIVACFTNPIYQCTDPGIIVTDDYVLGLVETITAITAIDDVAQALEVYSTGKHLGQERDPVPLSVALVTPQIIQTHFIDYYRLAHGVTPEAIRDDEVASAAFCDRVARCRRMLLLIQGRYDPKTSLLLEYLLVIINNSLAVRLPSSEDMIRGLFLHWQYIQDQEQGSSVALHDSFMGVHDGCKDALTSFLYIKYGFSSMKKLLARKSRIIATNAIKFLPMIGPMLSICQGVGLARVVLRKILPRLGAHHRIAPLLLQEGFSRITSAEIEDLVTESDDYHLPLEWCGLLVASDNSILAAATTMATAYLNINTMPLVPLEHNYEDDFATSQADGSLQTRFQRLHQSLVDYYRRERAPQQVFTFKNHDSPYQLYSDLQYGYSLLEETIHQDQQAVFDLVNHSLEIRGDETDRLRRDVFAADIASHNVTFDELLGLFLRDDDDEITTQIALSAEDIPKFKLAMYVILVKATQYQKMRDALSTLEAIHHLGDYRDPLFEKLMHKLGCLLLQGRSYPLNMRSSRLIRGYLAFEFKTGNALWAKPARLLREMLFSGHNRVVLEMIMGTGKTYFGVPLTAFFLADKRHLVVNIWPSTLAATNISQTGARAWSVFRQVANAKKIDRKMKLTRNVLWGILTVFDRAAEMGEQCNATKEDIQALELRLIEELFRCSRLEDKEIRQEQRLQYYMAILDRMTVSGRSVVDEAHEIFRRNKELNYPIGLGRSVPFRYISVIMRCMYFISRNRDMVAMITHNQQLFFSSEQYNLVKHSMARYVGQSMFHLDDEQLDMFDEYVCGELTTIPEMIMRSSSRSEIALVKGLITIIIPMVLKRFTHVNFGRSDNPEIESALPYHGNGNPVSATIRNPYEAIVKTFFMMFHYRFSSTYQLKKMIKALRADARREMKLHSTTNRYATWAARFFASHTRGGDLFKVREEQLETILGDINCSNEAILWYTGHCIASQIKYYPQNICSDSQNFMFFAACYGDTGTPYNSETFPLGTRVHHDPGTMGHVIHSMLEKSIGRRAVRTLRHEEPKEVLKEIIEKHFISPDSKMFALIECGAVLRGLDTITVAEMFLAKVQPHRPTIKGVAFCKTTGEWFVIQRHDLEPVPLEQCQLKKHERITYYDQPRTFAADVSQPPDAEAILTIGPQTMLVEATQAWGRMREIDKDQQITFAMTKRTQTLIVGEHRKPTVQDIITFSRWNEGQESLEDNYLSCRQIIDNIIRSEVIRKITSAEDVAVALEIFKEFQDVLITTTEEDPFELYGKPAIMMDTITVLQQHYQLKLRRVADHYLFAADLSRIETMMRKAISESTFPAKVLVYVDEDGVFIDAMADLGREQEVEQDINAEQHREEHREDERDMNLDLEVHQIEDIGTHKLPQPFTWNPSLTVADISWIQMERNLSGCPVFMMNHALSTSSDADIAALAAHVLPTIWISNNFIPITVQKTWEYKIAPCDPLQKPLFEILVVKEGFGDIKIIAVDANDALFWRQKLKKDRADETAHGVAMCLYDVSLDDVVAVGKNILTDVDLHNDPAFVQAIVQLKFLHGYVNYEDDRQKIILQEWIRRCGVAMMYEAFDTIYYYHPRGDFRGSDIEKIFNELAGRPEEELFC